MQPICNMDEMIREATVAANAHAEGVRQALGRYLASGAQEAEAKALRAELVALASGFEVGSHDGSTYAERQAAAQRALEAWDGSGGSLYRHDRTGIVASEAAWRALGAVLYATDFEARLPAHMTDELLLLGASATGSRAESAVVWAIGERQRRLEAAEGRRVDWELSRALGAVAMELGAESAEALVRRLPARLRPYAEQVLANRG